MLVILALFTGAIGYAVDSGGLLLLGLLGGLVLSLIGIFKPATARVVAPLYALAEGTGRHWVANGLDLDPATVATWIAEMAWGGLRSVKRIT